MMKYLASFGVDSKIAEFAEIYCRQKEKHEKWKFLKDFQRFAVGGQLLESEPEEDSSSTTTTTSNEKASEENSSVNKSRSETL